MSNLADTPSTAAKLRFSMRNLPLLEGGATMDLVMFRVGAAMVKDSSDLHPKFAIPNEAMQSRSDPQGRPAAGDDQKNGVAAQPTVFKAGAFFAAD